jgi:hypothetical protein
LHCLSLLVSPVRKHLPTVVVDAVAVLHPRLSLSLPS